MSIAKPNLSSNSLAPIALFVYNRPEHTRQTVEALRTNDLSRESDLFIFADGAKNDSAEAAVRAVREFVHTIDGFRSVTIIERERNLGLSKSVVNGVTQLCNEFGRAIVVEDDVVTAPDFLAFMNQGLRRYAEEPKIFSVCAFNVPIVLPKNYSLDAFYSHRFLCWGWGTWKNRWDKADWSVKDFSEFMADPAKQKQFSRGGDDLPWLLMRHMEGGIDSWDTIWGYTHSKHDALAVLPAYPRAINIGMDGSGVHCKRVVYEQHILTPGTDSDYRFPETVDVDPYFVAEIQRIHRPSMLTKLARFVRRLDVTKKRLKTSAALSCNVEASIASPKHSQGPTVDH